MVRLFPNKYPAVGDVVIGKVKKVEDTGVSVTLIEYEVDGLILFNQLSKRKKIRSMKKVVPTNSIQVLEVIAVDEERGYVDLSKKTITVAEKDEKELEWSKTKSVDSMIESASRKTKHPKEKIYEESIWPLYEKFPNTHILNIMEKVNDDNDLFVSENTEVKEHIMEAIKNKFMIKKQPYGVFIKLTFFKEEGIEMIKNTLRIASDKGFKPLYHAAPIYLIRNDYSDDKLAKKELTDICNEIKEFITEQGGELEIDKEPMLIADKK